MFRKTLAFFVLGSLMLISQEMEPEEILRPSICDLRERPDEFNGQVIKTKGWVYTDIERFGLEEEPNCAVALQWASQQTTKSRQAIKFSKLLKSSKRNPFETQGQLFAVLQGKFETVMVHKNGQLVMSGSGFGGGAGSAPSILVIQKVVCSVVAPADKTTITQASKRCLE
jgi:hypothetical protein